MLKSRQNIVKKLTTGIRQNKFMLAKKYAFWNGIQMERKKELYLHLLLTSDSAPSFFIQWNTPLLEKAPLR